MTTYVRPRQIFFPAGQLRPIAKGCGPTGFPCPPSTPGLGALCTKAGCGLGALGQGEETSGPSFYAEHPTLALVYATAGIVGTGVGAYHGYKRNGNSLGWGIAWGLLGGMFPIFVVPIALAQGVGKRSR